MIQKQLKPLRGNGANHLSLREFLQIAQLFDYRKKLEAKSDQIMAYRHGSGSDVQRLAPRTEMAKFDIYHIERDAELHVLCAGEDGQLLNVKVDTYKPYTNLLEWKKKVTTSNGDQAA